MANWPLVMRHSNLTPNYNAYVRLAATSMRPSSEDTEYEQALVDNASINLFRAQRPNTVRFIHSLTHMGALNTASNVPPGPHALI